MRLLIDLILELLGSSGSLQHLVLTVGQPVLQKVLAHTKGDNEGFPRETRPVQPAGQTTYEVHTGTVGEQSVDCC